MDETPEQRATRRRATTLAAGLVTVLGVVGIAATVKTSHETHGTAALDVTVATAPTIATTPTACRKALDDADAMIELALAGLDKAADGYEVVGNAVGDIAEFDLSGIDAATAQIKQIGRWFTNHADEAAADRAAYDKSKAECLNNT